MGNLSSEKHYFMCFGVVMVMPQLLEITGFQ